MTHALLGPGLGARRALGLGLAAALLGAGLAVASAGISAHAHNSVLETTPAAGEVLTELPETFAIRTSDELLDLGGEKTAFVIQDADGLYYGDGCVRIAGTALFTDAVLGAPGDYTITYQLVSADGHTIGSSYTFTWAPTGEVVPAAPQTERPRCGDEPTPGTAAPSPGTGGPTAPGTSEPPAEGTNSPPSGGIPSDVWWIAGAAAAVTLAVVVTLVATRRRGGVAD